MATPQNFKEVGKRLPKSVDSLGGLANAIAEANSVGTVENPLEISLAVPVTIANTADFTLDKTGYLSQVHGAHLDFNNQNGKVALIGQGVKDPTSAVPIFKNPAVNNFEDVTRKGVIWSDDGGSARLPKAISNELFTFTGSDADSFNKRVKAADEAFRGYPVTIICHPGRKTKSFMVLQPNRTIHFLKGDYENDIAAAATSADSTNHIEYIAPFLIGENTYFTGEDGARWFQSSVIAAQTGIPFCYPRWYAGDTFSVQGKFGVKNIEIHRGGVRASTGAYAVFNSGSMQMILENIKFIESVGFPVTVMSVETEDAISDGSRIINCTAENVYDWFGYHWNVLNGKNVHFINCHSLFNQDPPLDYDLGWGPLTGWLFAFADLEPNSNTDIVENITYTGCSVKYPKTLPSGHTLAGQSFVLQSPWRNMKNITIEGFKVLGDDTVVGNRHFLTGYGVDGLTVKNCENHRDEGGGGFSIDLRNSRNVDIYGHKSSFPSRLAIFRNVQNLRWFGNPVKSFDPTSINETSPTIYEEETIAPIHVLGSFYYSDRAFGNPSGFGAGLGHLNRQQELFVGLDFSINGQRTKVTSFNYPANRTSYVYKVGINHDFGNTTAKIFQNSNISGKQITITGHDFFDGQAVLMESDGTAPRLEDDLGNNYKDASGRVFIRRISANVVELAGSTEDALAGITRTPAGGTAGVNHRLRPFKVSYVFASAVNTTTNTITSNVAHGFVEGAFVEYSYIGAGAAAIGGLYQNNDVDVTFPHGNLRRTGAYKVKYVSATEFQLIELEGVNKGEIADLTSAGTGTQMFHLAARSFANEQFPSTYEVERGTFVELSDDSESRIAYPTDVATNPIGALPMVDSTIVLPSDDVYTALARILKAWEEANPPAWYADRIIDFDPASLTPTISNGANVDSFTDGITNTLTYAQATTALKGQLYHIGANGLPYLRVPGGGYAISGNFPNTTNPKVIAVVGRSSPNVDSGYFTTTLNNSTVAGAHGASWLLSLSYLDTLRHYNAGVVYSGAADRTNLQVIVIRINATNTKIWKNASVLATDASLKTLPTRLNFGDPYAANSVGAGTDYYRYTVWDADLSDDIIEDYIAYMMARFGIS